MKDLKAINEIAKRVGLIYDDNYQHIILVGKTDYDTQYALNYYGYVILLFSIDGKTDKIYKGSIIDDRFMARIDWLESWIKFLKEVNK